jgi:hypothetical protein
LADRAETTPGRTDIYGMETFGRWSIAEWAALSPAHRGGCWITSKPLTRGGYGECRATVEGVKVRGTHRVTFAEVYGSIPDGCVVCHHCDERRCCNPDHLFAAPKAINSLDMKLKGRARNGREGQTHCKRGHELVQPNLYAFDGHRHCKACILERSRAKYAARREAERQYVCA